MSGRAKYMILMAVLMILLLPFLLISCYVHPVADDLTYAYKGMTYGLMDNLAGEYLNWNGRYFSNMLVVLNPFHYAGLPGYQLVPVILILLLPVAFYLLLRVLFGNSIPKSGIFCASVLLTLLYINGMPQIAEGIYWYTGSVTYFTGNILFLLIVSLIVMQLHHHFRPGKRAIHYAAVGVLLFALHGLNEIHMIVMLLLFVLVNIIIYVHQKRFSGVMFLYLGFSLVFSLILILSPGNDVRAAHFPEAHKFWYSLYMSSAQTVRFMGEWLFSLPLLFASVLYISYAGKMAEKSTLIAVSFFLKPWQSLILLPAVTFAGAFPAYWATGILGQHRTMNVAYFFFVLLWFVNLTVFYNYFLHNRNLIRPGITERRGLRTLFVVFLILAIVISGNSRVVLEDMVSGRARSFNIQMNSRYSILSSGNDTVRIKRIVDPPGSIMVQDVSVDPGDWVNRSYALYFSGGSGGSENMVVVGE